MLRALGRSKQTSEEVAPLPFGPMTHDVESAPLEPDWLWQGYLSPGALTLLAGQPKAGKSTLVAGLLAALEQGWRFLGQPTRKSGALVLTEERLDGLVEKARRFRLGPGIHRLRRDQIGGTPWPDLVAQAIEHAEREALELLVVDTFAALAGLQGDEENDAGAVLHALEPLQAAADRGLAVLIVAHQRKAGGRHGSAVRGSNALIGAVDVVTELGRSGGQNARLLTAVSRFGATPSRLPLELTDEGYVARGVAVSEDSEALLLKTLGGLKWPSEADLREATGIPRTSLNRLLNKLYEAERVDKAPGARADSFVWNLAA